MHFLSAVAALLFSLGCFMPYVVELAFGEKIAPAITRYAWAACFLALVAAITSQWFEDAPRRAHLNELQDSREEIIRRTFKCIVPLAPLGSDRVGFPVRVARHGAPTTRAVHISIQDR